METKTRKGSCIASFRPTTTSEFQLFLTLGRLKNDKILKRDTVLWPL